jgi:hypothetical protein
MFRFSIRELLLITLVVALALGWALERRHSKSLERQLNVIETDARQSHVAIKLLHDDLERIERALAPHGLTLAWSKDFRPSLQVAAQSAGSGP